MQVRKSQLEFHQFRLANEGKSKMENSRATLNLTESKNALN